MEINSTICSKCHTEVKPTDYYCFNCGVNLRPVPPSTSFERQIMLYLGSFFLPPMGLFWSIKYLKQPNLKSRIVGLISIVLTLISLLITYLLLKNVADAVNSQMSSQVNNLMGF